VNDELLALRLRVAPMPRPAKARAATRAPRRAVLLHQSEGRHATVELLDGWPATCLVSLEEGSSDKERAAADGWAAGREVTAPGTAIPVNLVDRGQLGRFVAKRCWNRRTALVAFNLGGSVGALSAHVRKPKQRGGFSIALAGCGWHHRATGEWKDSDFCPRLHITSRGGEGGVFADWIPPRKRRKTKRRLGGSFIQLEVVGGALGYDVTSPADLAASAGVRWPERDNPLDQLLGEALALSEVYRLILAELAEVAPGLAPQDCWSAGTIVTHGLQQAGMRSPAESTATLPPWAIGAFAGAFHGGLPEALLVGVPLSMELWDLNATFAAMFSLLDLTPDLAADHFEAVPVDPGEVEHLFRRDGLRERLDDRAFWRSIGHLFVVVEPQGERLPCERRAGERWRFVVASLDLCGGLTPVHGCDLIGPVLDNQFPKVVSAFRIEPRGVAERLRPLRLPSGRELDLTVGGADYGRALIEERQLATAISDPILRQRREALAKSAAVSGAWGIFGREDRRKAPRPVLVVAVDEAGREHTRRHYPRRVTAEAIGPFGETLRTLTNRPTEAGPLTLWHIASSVPAACRAIVAITCLDIERDLGGSVAAIATDSIAVPAADMARLEACLEGRHCLAEGREAVRLPGMDELRAVLARSDRLLHPDGSMPAWREEVDSATKPSVGLVAGLNKLLLGREEDGRFHLVRSSDTGLGDHYLDPTGFGDRLDDGRTVWSATLEEFLLAEAVATGRVRVPAVLPPWADDRPMMRPGRASTPEDLKQLRRQLGDDVVAPFTCYVAAHTGGEHPPVALASGRDPATWRSWAWHNDGRQCRVAVPDRKGGLVVSDGTGRVFVARTARDVLEGWLFEHDVTVSGPRRGLRHVVPVTRRVGRTS